MALRKDPFPNPMQDINIEGSNKLGGNSFLVEIPDY